MTRKYSIASPVPEALIAMNMIDGLDACHESTLSYAGAGRAHLDFKRSPAMVIRHCDCLSLSRLKGANVPHLSLPILPFSVVMFS